MAVVVPDEEVVKPFAENNGLPTDMAKFCQSQACYYDIKIRQRCWFGWFFFEQLIAYLPHEGGIAEICRESFKDKDNPRNHYHVDLHHPLSLVCLSAYLPVDFPVCFFFCICMPASRLSCMFAGYFLPSSPLIYLPSQPYCRFLSFFLSVFLLLSFSFSTISFLTSLSLLPLVWLILNMLSVLFPVLVFRLRKTLSWKTWLRLAKLTGSGALNRWECL